MSHRYTLKFRANVFDVSDHVQFPPAFCEEADGFLHDMNSDGEDDCYCSDSAEQCTGSGCTRWSTSSYYKTDCADCSCGGAIATEVCVCVNVSVRQAV